MEYHQLINNLRYGMNDDVIDFFVGVSRFDYAFKEAGGFFSRDKGASPNVDWDDLVPNAFAGFETKCADLSETELFTRPPRDYRRIDGVAMFTSAPGPLTDTRSIFKAIWMLRKNLMHGTKGKLIGRDQALVKDANVVLARAYQHCAGSTDGRLKRVAEIMATTEASQDEDSGA